MKTLLIPVSPDDALRVRTAVTDALRAHAREEVRVHLLSVQPRVSGHVAMYFGKGELLALQEKAGHEDMRQAAAWLDEAGVPFTTRVRVGRTAQTIAEAARDLRCDRILFGAPQEPARTEPLFGSLAQQVRHLLAGWPACEVVGS